MTKSWPNLPYQYDKFPTDMDSATRNTLAEMYKQIAWVINQINPGQQIINSVATAVHTAITSGGNPLISVTLAPGAAGNFTIAHLAGAIPIRVTFECSAGSFLFQSPSYDATNLYLIASDDYAAGVAKVETA